MESKYKQQRKAEYDAVGLKEDLILSTARPKKKGKIEPIYISTKKPRTVGPNDKGNNWPGNISKSKKAHPAGGEGVYSDELAEKICERMCLGEAPTQICKDPTMPSYPTVIRWSLSEDPKYAVFQVMFDEAKKIMWMYHADQMLDVSDDSVNDYIERYNKFTEEMERVVDPENIQRAKLRVDTRKWLLSKMLPHLYGDKVDVSIGGRNGKAIAVTTITMTAEEAERAYMDMINGTSPKQIKQD